MLRITLDPPRFNFGRDLKHRAHHGPPGIMLIALGVALVASDWRDRKRWVADLRDCR